MESTSKTELWHNILCVALDNNKQALEHCHVG